MTTQIYQCPICGLHYEDEVTAEQCAVWCKEHNSCSLDIAKASIEHQEYEKKREEDESRPAQSSEAK